MSSGTGGKKTLLTQIVEFADTKLASSGDTGLGANADVGTRCSLMGVKSDSKRSSDGSPRRSERPAPDAIRVALSRVIESSEFSKSVRLQRFLTYVVQETLEGRGDALKEYSIAIEVFDRDPSFDPQSNSLVRVEASRLRSKLQIYYTGDGLNDLVRISLPAGTYVPNFEAGPRTASPSANASWADTLRRFVPARMALIVAAVLVFVAATTSLILVIGDRTSGKEGTAKTMAHQRPKAIAVLPLRNLSGKRDEDFFSDGMTEALITALAKHLPIPVISFTSAFAYKDNDRPIADIARDLNVSHVIQGSILRKGNRVRISSQLVEAATAQHVWAESYERDWTDVLAIQDDVARHIVGSLSGGIKPLPDIAPKAAAAIDPEAQLAYLKGRYFRNQMTEDGFRRGVGYFKKAIEKAPKFAEAYSGMAACYCLLGGHGFELVEPREGMPAAKKAVMEAMRLDDTVAEAHAFLGIIRLKYEWDWSGAEQAFQRAIQLNPSYAQARMFYSFFLEAMGRQGEAIREAEAARTIDPLSLPANVNLSWQYLRAGQLERALKQLEITRELRSDFWGVHWGFGHYHRRKGTYVNAIKSFEKAVEVGGGYTLPMTDLGYTYAIAGNSAKAREMLVRLKTMAGKSYVSPYNMATIHVGLGEVDLAFDWLKKAFESRSRSLAWLKVASEYDALRTDPRFISLVERIGLPE